ncbi:MAG: hypothetical protein KGO53_10235 [Alphaproteobacteria bacterium]|nr:hypothetical protein [Alphaproteobacteria bacterium]
MLKRLPVLLISLFTAAGGSLAEEAPCPPEKLASAIDAFQSGYQTGPFSATAWRQLSGLGNPQLGDISGGFGHDWQESKNWKELVGKLAPGNQKLAEPAYDCRLGYPLAVLKSRIAALGEKSPYITEWLKAQAVVFGACADTRGGEVNLPEPSEPKPEWADLQRADRAYQQASIAFYRDRPKAIEQFRAIAAGNSPHRAYARYNIANLLAADRKFDEARGEVDAILADPGLAEVRGITLELKGYIQNQQDTQESWSHQIDDLVSTLSQPAATIAATDDKTRFANAIYDLDHIGVRDSRDDWWITRKLPKNATLSAALADAARKSPMVLWMMTGQTIAQRYDEAPWSMVGPRWQAWAKDFESRALALQPGPGAMPALARELLDSLTAGTDNASRAKLWSLARQAGDKAKASCGAAPETAALGAFAQQATRLSAQAGKFDEIYKGLSSLPLAGTQTRSAILHRFTQFLLATGNVGQGHALLKSQLISASDDWTATTTPWLAADKKQWLGLALGDAKAPTRLNSVLYNFLPPKELQGLALDERFTGQERALLERAAWTRKYATGNAVPLDALKLNPEITAARDETAKTYPSLSKNNLLLLTILRNPRFGILVTSPDAYDSLSQKRDQFDEIDAYDHNDKNWWCPWEPDRQLAALRAEYDSASGLAALTSYGGNKALAPLLEPGAIAKAQSLRDAVLRQHPMIKVVDWRALRALAQAPSAPRKLTEAALAWAKAAKGDDGAPEALALAVRVTRYGCNWHGGHGTYSRPAQELLKAKWPGSEWTAKTPYWFDCQRNVWDKSFNKVPSCAVQSWPKQAPLN